MRHLGRNERGGSPPLLLAACSVVVLLLLLFGTVDYLGALATREHVQTALVASVRAAVRQIDRSAWVYEHQVRLRNQLVRANLDLDRSGYPLRPDSLIEGPVKARLDVDGTRVTGRLVVPVRTRFLGHRVSFKLSYAADARVSGDRE